MTLTGQFTSEGAEESSAPGARASSLSVSIVHQRNLNRMATKNNPSQGSTGKSAATTPAKRQRTVTSSVSKSVSSKSKPARTGRFTTPKIAYDSGSLVELRLAATGNAQVIVYLNREAKASKRRVSEELGRHFSLEKESHIALLAKTSARAGKKRPPPFRFFPRLGVVLGTVNGQGFQALRRKVGTELVSAVQSAPALALIPPVRIQDAPAPQERLTWGLKALEVDQLWAQGFTGSGVLVAHLDTGLDGTHPMLQGAVSAFAQFDEVGNLVTPSPPAFDSSEIGHGTHTAATLAGRPVDARSVGIAPGALLLSAMVIDGGNAQSRVVAGLEWAIQQRAKVLSMSLGFSGSDPSIIQMIQILRDEHDVVPVIAVGNEGVGRSRSPGSYEESLSVGACDEAFSVPSFSGSQYFQRPRNALVPDVIAPGVNVLSAAPGGGFRLMWGTSMSTPHIAGLAAILRQANPNATADAVEQAIFASCQPVPAGAIDRTERGIPNGPRALALL